MKTRNMIWVALLAGLFTQPLFAADAPGTKAKAPELKAEAAAPKVEKPEAISAPITKYEISVDRKVVKGKYDLAELAAKLEASEDFKASECGRIDIKKKGVLSYSCSKVTCKTDDLFRGTTSQPGVKLLALSMSITCPLGCKMSTACTGGQYYTCCRIPVPNQRCATGSW